MFSQAWVPNPNLDRLDLYKILSEHQKNIPGNITSLKLQTSGLAPQLNVDTKLKQRANYISKVSYND